jgi:cysteine synthase A
VQSSGALSPAAPPPATTGTPSVDTDAADFVAKIINNAQQPVVMFALEWCEFCWALRNVFARFEIAYRSIDLDSVEYQSGGRGGDIRTALAARTSVSTIPQVFVAGEFIGGCTDTLDALKTGRLQQIMDRSKIPFNHSLSVDPHSFLPSWLHPRG